MIFIRDHRIPTLTSSCVGIAIASLFAYLIIHLEVPDQCRLLGDYGHTLDDPRLVVDFSVSATAARLVREEWPPQDVCSVAGAR